MTDTKILIVDDDALVRSSLTFLLKRAGYLPTQSVVRKKHFRRYVKKISGCLDGYEFYPHDDRRRRNPFTEASQILRPDLPVILMTAWGSISLAVTRYASRCFRFHHETME